MRWRRPTLAAGLVAVAGGVVLAVAGWPLGGTLAAAAGLGAAMAAVNVPRDVESADAEAAARLMAGFGAAGIERPQGFAAELDLAYDVQAAVFAVAPFEKRDPQGRKVPLPIGGRRELSDLLDAGTGLCFDRSRAIETILRLHGLEVRHVALFSLDRTGSAWRAVLRRGSSSHSLTEVRTERGWMAIDSNYRWIGVSKDGVPYDMAKLRTLPEVEWDARNGAMGPKLQQPFTWIYGLYSRHGRFYPPFVAFPNVNWAELAHNLWP